MMGQYVRWTFNLSKPGDTWEEHVLGPSGDMPRTAVKDLIRAYDVGYYQTFDPTVAAPLVAGPVGAGFNTILRLEINTGKLKRLPMDQHSTVQEHAHIPSSVPGHEGYLLFLVDRHDRNETEAFVVEAEHIDKGPLARIQVPLRLRVGVHGNWVPASELQ
jgi:carotenoid cleavage dioxygenase